MDSKEPNQQKPYKRILIKLSGEALAGEGEYGIDGNKTSALAKEIAAQNSIEVHDGVYLGLQGPTFETLAEYRMVKILGADCVGMSTVPEVIVARHMELEVFGLSVITDMGDEENIEEVNHAEVLKAAQKTEPSVRLLIKELIKNY